MTLITDLKKTLAEQKQKMEWSLVVETAKRILAEDPTDTQARKSLADAYDKVGNAQNELVDTWCDLVDIHKEIEPYARKAGFALKKRNNPKSSRYFLIALEHAIEVKHFKDIEDLWLELIADDAVSNQIFLDNAQKIVLKKHPEKAAELLAMVLETRELKGIEAIPFIRFIVTHQPANQETYREMLLSALTAAYSNRPDVGRLIELADIAGHSSLAEALASFERFLKFGQGQFFYHQSWGTGKVTRLEPDQQRIFIDFTKKKGHILSLEIADRSLDALDPEDLRALLYDRKDEVVEWVKSDPKRVVKSAIIAMGGKASSKEIKDLLVSDVITPSAWTKWWTEVNKALKDDPLVEVAGTSQKTYSLRENPESLDEEYLRRFNENKTLRGKLDLLAEYLQTMHDAPDGNVIRKMAEDLVRKSKLSHLPGEVVEAYFAILDLPPDLGFDSSGIRQLIDPIIHNLDTAVDALEGIKNSVHQKRWFTMMEETLQDELSQAYERLLQDGPDMIRDLVADHVKRVHEENKLDQLFRKIRLQARELPGLFVWFAGNYLPDPTTPQRTGMSRPALLESLINLHEVLSYRAKTGLKEQAPELRAIMSSIRQIFKRGNFALMREVLKETDTASARGLWKATENAMGIEDRIRRVISAYLISHFSESVLTGKDITTEEEDALPYPERLLCLPSTLQAKLAQFKQIQEVDIPQNTREIETARQHGDLRENAEYHAAKDKQKLLQSLMATLQLELSRASAIDEPHFSNERVQFGSVVRFRLGESERTVTLLGPWESDPDAGFLSYESPLGKVLWGKRVGDKGQFTSGTGDAEYEILDIQVYVIPHDHPVSVSAGE